MAGLINWRKVSIPTSSPDSNHVYVGVDSADGKLYVKDATGQIFKYQTSVDVLGAIAQSLIPYDTTSVVDGKISNAISTLVNGAGSSLDTLNELATALGNDPNFATTISTSLGNKADKSITISAGTGLTGGGSLAANRTISLPNVGTPGGFGSASKTVTVTTDAQGRVSSIFENTIAILAAAVSDFSTAVRSTVLTGITFSNTVIAGTDSVFTALGKLQGQVTAIAATDISAIVRATTLTGISIVDGAISATDSVLSALGKLQGQIDVWDEKITTATVSNTSASTGVAVSEIGVSVTSGRTYYVEWTIPYVTAATTTGAAFSVNTPDSAAGTLSLIINLPAGATGTAGLFSGDSSGFGVWVTSPATLTGRSVAKISGSFICTSSGTLVPQFRSEVLGSSVTIQPAAVMLARKF